MSWQPCTTLEQRWSACREHPAQVMWQVMHLYPFFGEADRPCSSPSRHQCRAGTTMGRHGYFARAAWRLQQLHAGRRGYAHTHWERSDSWELRR